jgi:ABC-2 type transport system ATP-binding protein
MSASISNIENSPILTVDNLRKSYGDSFVLRNVSLEIRADEIVGLIGPNGAGKTTLLECIAGLLPLDSGTLTWREEHCAADSRDRLFYLADQILPYPEQYTVHVLEFFADLYNAPTDQFDRAVTSLDLKPILAKRILTLSKGYKKRVLLCIILLVKHPVLLLDEPFDGLDLRQTLDTMSMLRDLRGAGKTLLISIHQISDAEKLCDRFLLLSNGNLLGAGTLNDIREQASVPRGSLEEVFLALA